MTDLERARVWVEQLRADCHQTFMGGHSGAEYKAFVHGMDTVCNVLGDALPSFVAAVRREALEEAIRAVVPGNRTAREGVNAIELQIMDRIRALKDLQSSGGGGEGK